MNERTFLALLAFVVFVLGLAYATWGDGDPRSLWRLLFGGLATLALTIGLPPRIRR